MLETFGIIRRHKIMRRIAFLFQKKKLIFGFYKQIGMLKLARYLRTKSFYGSNVTWFCMKNFGSRTETLNEFFG